MQTTRGGRKLKEWLKDRGHNQEWFAEQLSKERGERVYQSSVSAWARGASLIPLWGGLTIQKLTGIPASDWMIPEETSSPSLKRDRVRHQKAG